MKYFLMRGILLLFIIGFSGCKKKSIQLLQDEFSDVEKVNLMEYQDFNTEEIKFPVEMAFSDGLLFFRNFSGEYFISVFDAKQGRFIGDMARKGIGPEEFLSVSSLVKKDKGISFYDLNLHKLFFATHFTDSCKR